MELLFAIVGGVACGLAAATPLFVQLKGGKTDLGRGFGAVIIAFLAIQLAMFVVHALAPAALAPFGVTATLVFLAMTTCGALFR